jgi:hypothetical protein
MSEIVVAELPALTLDHGALPRIRDASLPARYEAAKQALAECFRVDECQDWADKMAALASYARQSEDRELETFALRIRARAIRRCGDVLREIEPAPGRRTDLEPSGTAPTRFGAAKEAGLSRDQAVTALRTANVPEAEFEAAVESDDQALARGPHTTPAQFRRRRVRQ